MAQNSQNCLIKGIEIPGSELAREITEFIRDTETEILFNHSSRVYCFGALAGGHRGLKVDPELLYTGAMFHDLGLMPAYSSSSERFEVDGANAAREFLQRHGIGPSELDDVWMAIALHTTPGIPQHMRSVAALVTAGVEMDVLGIEYDSFEDSEREAIVECFPRTVRFKKDILQVFLRWS